MLRRSQRRQLEFLGRERGASGVVLWCVEWKGPKETMGRFEV